MALLDIVKKGSTDRAVYLRIIDSTDGTPETGVVYNTSGIDLWYRREGAAATSITEATLAGLTTAHTDGGFLHVGNGVYRLDLPDAAFATGANHVHVGGTVTGMIVIGGTVRLVDVDLEDTVRAGLTSLPNAAAAASGGLFTRGTGAGQINQDANGRIDVNIAAISTDTTSADNLEAFTDGTGYAGGTIPLGANVTQWRGTQPNTLTSGRVETLVGAMASDVVTASAIAADAIGASELAAGAASEIAAAVMASVAESQGSYTVQQILSIVLAVLAGETTDNGATILTPNAAATRVAATIDGSNNRTTMTLTPSA